MPLLFSTAQSCLISSSSIRLRWQLEILDDLRSQEVVMDKQMKAATTKQTVIFAFWAICESCRTRKVSGAGPLILKNRWAQHGIRCTALVSPRRHAVPPKFVLVLY